MAPDMLWVTSTAGPTCFEQRPSRVDHLRAGHARQVRRRRRTGHARASRRRSPASRVPRRSRPNPGVRRASPGNRRRYGRRRARTRSAGAPASADGGGDDLRVHHVRLHARAIQPRTSAAASPGAPTDALSRNRHRLHRDFVVGPRHEALHPIAHADDVGLVVQVDPWRVLLNQPNEARRTSCMRVVIDRGARLVDQRVGLRVGVALPRSGP